MMLNKNSIANILRTRDEAVDRAMVVLYQRQTQDERIASDTRHSNQRGFSAAHAKLGSYYARWVLKGRRLTGRHLVRAREIALHYTGQLLEAAQQKASQRASLAA
jgi:hypothetical protein